MLNLEIKTKELQKVLRLVETALPNKASIAVVNGLLFNVSKDSVSIIATDLENTVKAKTKCVANEECDFVVNGKKLISLVNKFNSDTISFTYDKNSLEVQVKSGKSAYKFLTYVCEEFPVFPERDKEAVSLSFNSEELNKALNSVSFCVDSEEPRPHFRGILFDVSKGKTNLVSTDTKQLAVNTGIVSSGASAKFLLPLRTAGIFSKVLEPGNAEILVSKNNIFVKQEGLVLVSQLLSGAEDFPDYHKVMPAEKDLTMAEIPAAELKVVFERLCIFTTERYQKIVLNFSNNKLELFHTNPESGEAKEEMEVKYSGEDKMIALNPSINAYISKVSGKTILCGIKNEKSPLLLKGMGKNHQYIVMPLKLEV